MAKYYLKNGDVVQGPFNMEEIRKTDLSDFVEFREEGQTPWEPIVRLESFLVNDDTSEAKDWTSEIKLEGVMHHIEVKPDKKSMHEGIPQRFEIRMDNALFGNITYSAEGWQMDVSHPASIVSAIGNMITEYYE